MFFRHLKHTSPEFNSSTSPKPNPPPLFSVSWSSITLHLVSHTKKRVMISFFPFIQSTATTADFSTPSFHTLIIAAFVQIPIIFYLIENISLLAYKFSQHIATEQPIKKWKFNQVTPYLKTLQRFPIATRKNSTHLDLTSLMVFSARKMT